MNCSLKKTKENKRTLVRALLDDIAGMVAFVHPIQSLVIAEVDGVNRVLWDVSDKPIATIE